MCSVLLTIFSSYGIYNLAATLGVKFLDKLESVVDYHSTCKVLDLTWIAVACAIQIHVIEKQIENSQIEGGDNNLLKKTLVQLPPLKHPLFKNNNQLNNEGCQKLFKYYDAGLERLKKIYRQEILQIETVNTKGRRAKEVVVSKVKDIKKAEKEAEKAAKSSGK
ncbi:hypothetical protein RclHR1_16570002 [Rhizophagus clarus]|uniref:Uncharacterized protein n=1 Tax=Rhizophagus clarus TaxID=94130 RepID=A0A2Z6QHX3_9GLOM|nr:hypothetical protein RclHR1_16570002 [Rhizophagus clarus]